MIELIFVTCFAAAPATCHERSLIFTDVSPAQCLMGAQPELAKWVNEHPGEQIRSWKCQMVSFEEHDA